VPDSPDTGTSQYSLGIDTLRPLRSATIMIGHQRLTAEPRVPTQTQPILDALTQSAH
jgi:hypothetical protein